MRVRLRGLDACPLHVKASEATEQEHGSCRGGPVAELVGNVEEGRPA